LIKKDKKSNKIQDDVVVIHDVNDKTQTVKIKNFNLKNFKIIYPSKSNATVKGENIKISPRSTLILRKNK
jgi:hypothetical protein